MNNCDYHYSNPFQATFYVWTGTLFGPLKVAGDVFALSNENIFFEVIYEMARFMDTDANSRCKTQSK